MHILVYLDKGNLAENWYIQRGKKFAQDLFGLLWHYRTLATSSMCFIFFWAVSMIWSYHEYSKAVCQWPNGKKFWGK